MILFLKTDRSPSASSIAISLLNNTLPQTAAAFRCQALRKPLPRFWNAAAKRVGICCRKQRLRPAGMQQVCSASETEK